MSDAIAIRPARLTDAGAVASCAELAYSRYISAIGRAPAPMHADFPSQIAAGHVHIATGSDGLLLGFLVAVPDGDDILLENVAVLPSAAGRGVGKALIAFCERTAAQRGARAVRLYTNVKMIENLSIYPHLGYIETDRRTEDGFDRVYFVKVLRDCQTSGGA